MNKFFDENKATEGHGRRSARGGAISIAARAIDAIVQIASSVVLARLLSPEDYGLVSMILIITGFASVVVDLGTRDAVVQRNSITHGEVSALFWITLAISCACTLLAAASGPFIARFYGEPRLTEIVAVSSLAFVLTALTCQHHALMRRAMMFKRLAVIEVGASVLSYGISIAMALRGWHYWALLVRPIVMTLSTAVALWFSCRWLPTKPTITSGVMQMIKFGVNLIVFSVTDVVGNNSDRVAIGHSVGAKGLGYYQNALLVYNNLLTLSFPLHGVAVVSLSKLRDDPPALRRLWAHALSTLTFYAMPAFVILAVTGADLVVILFGQKWANSGTLLSVLALRGIPHVVERTLGWLHVAAGRTDRWMKWGIIGLCGQLFALFVGLPYGPMGVVVAYVLCMYILFVPAIVYAGHPLGIGSRQLVRVIGPQLIGALCSAACGFVLRYTLLSEFQGLGVVVMLALIVCGVFFAIVVGLFGVTTPLKVVLSLLRDFLGARFEKLSFPMRDKS